MDFTKSRLYGISNKKYLSELIQLELKTLKNVDSYYEVAPFFKKVNGKKRELYNPSEAHKRALKNIVKGLSYIGFPDYVYGGIPLVGYVDNASRHLEKEYLLLLDITNFFPSTKDSYVYSFFHNTMSQSEDLAKILTNLTTVKKGDERFLPQGFSTSPMLTFLSYHQMYEELNAFSKRNNFTFSAYYDDFTFSSDKFIHTNKRREAIAIIEKYGLQVNKKKTRLTICNHTRVTGVIIHGDTKKAPKKLHKKMYDYYRLLLDMDKEPTKYTQDEFIDTCNRLQGCLAAIQSIERERNLEHYKNTLRHVRTKFDVPVEKKKKQLYFRNIEVNN
ncbi:reverse transcriptase family protein [Enterococcus durans]|uniref:reverse transcriptase family protein n=1 Tax=Enterococcus durans TaxID=53345 RepID=UPI00232FE4F0|nr:reverse transcriptase family protein [Enterococcus durans]MDB1653538.1 reverse transcriptase family protein [Enterococcus durans]MDB1655037.1 reverse transcriptase family protein [Enterococcus durans]MDB1664593.1 reverse transcriptase family protein [Enterococcus durans]MDB1668648.1 reverse transcriptase family protein [Enterococcus durans]MDB1671642.1 reverse transcriptase family protein [Enterococcus durans]